MALLNYLANGTYSAIDRLVYDPVFPRCTWILSVYSNAQREILYASKEFEASRYEVIFAPTELELRANPPVNPQEGESYCVAQNATGEWTGVGGQYTKREDGAWRFWGISPWQVFAFDGDFYRIKNGVFVKVDCLTAPEVWDRFFAKPAVYSPGTSITRQIYLAMLSLPSMVGVTSDE
jgi:hypothetical protein